MKSPVLELLDHLLSHDDAGVMASLRFLRQQLPSTVTAQLPLLPPPHHGDPLRMGAAAAPPPDGGGTTSTATLSWLSSPSSSGLVFAYLSAFLQFFPHVAAVGSTQDGSLPLHFAASSGDATLCRIVWQAFPTGAMTPNHKGKIPLHYAAREGRTAVVHFFLQVAPLTATMASGKDKLALHFAAGEGHFQVVQALLRVYPQGAQLPSAKGKLPLHFCSRWGHQNVATELLRYYPEAIRALDWEGSLPLHEACREGQVDMARFLVDRFPEALSTASIRNELPLLRAVHANSLPLVLELLQAWPGGARHVLQHVQVDDRVPSWNPAILEALLRATVECWDGFAPWQTLPHASLRLHAPAVNHVLPMGNEDSEQKDAKKTKKKKDKAEKKERKAEKKEKAKKKEDPDAASSSEVGTIEDRAAWLWTAGPFTSIRIERFPPVEASSDDMARSARRKSPILGPHQPDEALVRPRKRARSAYRRHSEEAASCTDNGRVVFNPLQVALQAHATFPVLKHVQQLFPNAPVDVVDSQNRSLLHLALENGNLARDESQRGGVDWILEHLFRPEYAMRRERRTGALPLHTALHSRASARLVKPLIRAHPSSAVDQCETRDAWEFEKPLAVACQGDCDLSTVYLLLRADPGAIHGGGRNRPARPNAAAASGTSTPGPHSPL